MMLGEGGRKPKGQVVLRWCEVVLLVVAGRYIYTPEAYILPSMHIQMHCVYR